jgi:hypothetical protein
VIRIAALCLVGPLLLLAVAGCGGDDDGTDATATSDASSNNGTPAATLTPSESPTATPEQPIATPTRVADTDPLMVVNYGETVLQPTAADVAAMPQTPITGIDGQTYTGVTLADLAAAMGAPSDGYVEMRGIRSDGKRLVTLRYSLTDNGTDTVVYVADSGNVDLVSASVPQSNWLTAIMAISYL